MSKPYEYEPCRISFREDKAGGEWYRVFEPDGSTVAFCPDVVTARIIATAAAKAAAKTRAVIAQAEAEWRTAQARAELGKEATA